MSPRASNVGEAYFESLWRHDDDVWTHPSAYVDRKMAQAGSSLAVHLRLRDELLHARDELQRVFTGQVGAGKSTELRELVSDPDLRARYEIVVVDAEDRLNLARFVDVRFLLTAFAEGLAGKLGARVLADAAADLLVKARAAVGQDPSDWPRPEPLLPRDRALRALEWLARWSS